MDRKLLKANAKEAFKANYWRSVAVGVITTLIAGGGFAASSGGSVNINSNSGQLQQLSPGASDVNSIDPQIVAIVLAVFAGIFCIVAIISTVYGIFVGDPMKMGGDSFYLKNSDDSETSIEEIKTGFTPNYGRNVKTFFLKKLFIFLWSLLFVIPGIVKGLGYSMTNYILAEDPDIGAKEALKKSEEMMKGHKGELFMLMLSFFGWGFLAALTCGILGIFYVGPYINATNAEFYKALKEEY